MTRTHLVWGNLTRRKLRLLLTLTSIFSVFVIFGVLASFDRLLESSAELSGSDRLVSVSRISRIMPLPLSHANQVAALEGVRRVSYAVWFGGYYGDPKHLATALAVDPKSYLDTYPEIRVDPQERAAFLANRRGALVGETLAREFGWQRGDSIPLHSNIFANREDGSQIWQLEIEGIHTAADRRQDTAYLLMHYDYLNQARTFYIDTLAWMVVTADSSEASEETARRIDARFANSSAETRTESEKALMRSFVDQFGDVGLLIASVAGAGLFTILLVVGNTMMLAVHERRNEIAILKTLGFSNAGVFLQVVAESIVLLVLGGVPGLWVARWVVARVRDTQISTLAGLELSWDIALQGVASMIVLGVAIGLVPAYRALRLDVASALGKA